MPRVFHPSTQKAEAPWATEWNPSTNNKTNENKWSEGNVFPQDKKKKSAVKVEDSVAGRSLFKVSLRVRRQGLEDYK